MIVCSCNVISDRDIRAAAAGDPAVRTVGGVYRRLGGCRGQCHRCARSIKAVLDQIRHGDCGCNGVCRQQTIVHDDAALCGDPPLLEAAE